MKKHLLLGIASLLFAQSAKPMQAFMAQENLNTDKQMIAVQNNLKRIAKIMLIFTSADVDPKKEHLLFLNPGKKAINPGSLSIIPVDQTSGTMLEMLGTHNPNRTQHMNPYLVWSLDPDFPDKEPYALVFKAFNPEEAAPSAIQIEPGKNEKVKFVKIIQNSQLITLQEQSAEDNI